MSLDYQKGDKVWLCWSADEAAAFAVGSAAEWTGKFGRVTETQRDADGDDWIRVCPEEDKDNRRAIWMGMPKEFLWFYSAPPNGTTVRVLQDAGELAKTGLSPGAFTAEQLEKNNVDDVEYITRSRTGDPAVSPGYRLKKSGYWVKPSTLEYLRGSEKQPKKEKEKAMAQEKTEPAMGVGSTTEMLGDALKRGAKVGLALTAQDGITGLGRDAAKALGIPEESLRMLDTHPQLRELFDLGTAALTVVAANTLGDKLPGAKHIATYGARAFEGRVVEGTHKYGDKLQDLAKAVIPHLAMMAKAGAAGMLTEDMLLPSLAEEVKETAKAKVKKGNGVEVEVASTN